VSPVIAGQAQSVEHQPRVSGQPAKRLRDGTGVRPDQADGETPRAGHVFGSVTAPDPRVVIVPVGRLVQYPVHSVLDSPIEQVQRKQPGGIGGGGRVAGDADDLPPAGLGASALPDVLPDGEETCSIRRAVYAANRKEFRCFVRIKPELTRSPK